MHVEIRPQLYDPWQEVARFQAAQLRPGSYGACAAFIGSMRDFNQGAEVASMELEHYPGMTENLLQEYGREVEARFGLLELLVLHRVGRVYPDDAIVLVAAWSAHRAAAFDGCRAMMEHLKSQATFWKQETLTDNRQRWVDNRP